MAKSKIFAASFRKKDTSKQESEKIDMRINSSSITNGMMIGELVDLNTQKTALQTISWYLAIHVKLVVRLMQCDFTCKCMREHEFHLKVNYRTRVGGLLVYRFSRLLHVINHHVLRTLS